MTAPDLKTQDLLTILEISRQMAEQRMVQPLLEFVAKTVFDLVPAERCLTVLFGERGELVTPIARTRQGEPIPNAADQISTSILEQVRADLSPTIVNDALADQLLRSAKSVRSLGLRSVMCVPLVSHGAAIGAIYVENRRAGGQFREESVVPLVLLANQVVVALENARMVESLEATVAERTRELSQAIANLRSTQSQLIQSEKMAALGNLVAGVAHELRNPLNFVNSLAQLSLGLVAEIEPIAQSIAQPENPASASFHELLSYLRRNCQEIYSSGQRANAIISMMLLHTRSDTGERELIDLNDVVRQAINLAYHSIRARNPSAPQITIEQQLDDSIPRIVSISQQLSQALINLLDNACYAVLERCQREPAHQPTLRVVTLAADQHVEIHIWDNGVGIARDMLTRIFDPFVTTKPPGEGTGLGLSLTYEIIVQTLGGTIGVTSEPGQGTEFTVSLPLRPQPPARP